MRIILTFIIFLACCIILLIPPFVCGLIGEYFSSLLTYEVKYTFAIGFLIFLLGITFLPSFYDEQLIDELSTKHLEK